MIVYELSLSEERDELVLESRCDMAKTISFKIVKFDTTSIGPNLCDLTVRGRRNCVRFAALACFLHLCKPGEVVWDGLVVRWPLALAADQGSENWFWLEEAPIFMMLCIRCIIIREGSKRAQR